jgi:3-oxoacyl-[acyl-carrier-protein] synthase II
MPPERTRVVVTGIGVVTAAGCHLETMWRGLLAGRSAVGRIQRFDVSAYPSQVAAQVDDEAVECSAAWTDRARIARYAARAASDALDASRLAASSVDRRRVGVIVAAGMGSYDHREIFSACAAAAGRDRDDLDWHRLAATLRRELRPQATARLTPGSIPVTMAAEHGLRGPTMAVMTACAGGTQAIGDALRWIRAGRADAVVAVGADSELYPMGLASFCLLGALSTQNDRPAAASRPFDRSRDGFVLGEGAAALVLESLDHAERRNAHIWGEVAGFGSAADAFRVTDPHPQGAGAVLAMNRALADAHLGPDAVDYINAHGTSTPANDRAETLAIRTVFAARAARIPISSTKSMIGHATVAAGAIEAAVVLLTLRDQIIHPTINYETPDPACDLDYVPNTARAARLDVAMSNSFAFGGQAASVLFSRYVQ